MEQENNLQELLIKVKLVENFKVDEAFIYDVLNGLGDHLVPVNEISLNGNILFDSKNGFHRDNFKGGINNDRQRNEDESGTGSK